MMAKEGANISYGPGSSSSTLLLKQLKVRVSINIVEEIEIAVKQKHS